MNSEDGNAAKVVQRKTTIATLPLRGSSAPSSSGNGGTVSPLPQRSTSTATSTTTTSAASAASAATALAPLRRRRDSKRDALVTAARDEFASHGFLGTHIAIVAARVGIRKSTFFHYYEDKESLYEAAVGGVLTELAELVEGAALGSTTFLDRLDLIIECLHRQLAIDATMPRLLLRSLVDTPPSGAPRPTAIDRIATQIAEMLRLGVREGRLPPTDVARATPALIAIMCAEGGGCVIEPMSDEALLGATPDMKLSDTKDRLRRFLGLK